MKYYCDSSFKSNEKWQLLLNRVINISDTVEFNILKKNYTHILDKELLHEAYLLIESVDNKIYPNGKYIRFFLTENVKKFVTMKNYADWYNYCIEDISFRSDGAEILATITHEDYIIMLMDEGLRRELNSQGFEFEMEWLPK